MRFWDVNKKELAILRKLNSEYNIDFDKVFKDKKILVSERRGAFVITKDAYHTLKKMKKDPYSAGLLIGKIKKEKFDIGLEGMAMIAAHSEKTITLDSRQEQVVLYGGDVTSKSAING